MNPVTLIEALEKAKIKGKIPTRYADYYIEKQLKDRIRKLLAKARKKKYAASA